MRIMELTTKIDSPNPKSKSLRAYIPREVVRFLNIKKGDELLWLVEAEDNEFKISLEKK
jgi:bifunctional DNA-binding transcriptional regulator/antitoxin component of YhaV-PrlF toxin-antitoxin module